MKLSETDSLISTAKRLVEEIPGKSNWTYNPVTGSMVIEYDPEKTDADYILNRIATKVGLKGVVIDTKSKLHRSELINVVLDAVQDVNRIANHATGGKADLRELIPAALGVVSAVTFVLGDRRGGRLPRWDSALYHSYRIFMQWHRVEVRDREKTAKKSKNKFEKHRELGREFL
jgi:hypothetical protein